ncbi:Mov34/MPN/PAD-1 family protein [Pedobacter sandarakinus]|uniref:Mov34/MPN/PAD-1 family protein n=1 Tax=Pedobacter sandarakinus TaxID=353156 RepID=UPI002247B312|nr:Mov34/MPN/PAD-1 family protein [Pedobacter sandarakinus]MCX2575073.1 Mov34/MPN/PAD-1 family protein [Pedobacter sandarakinus]
MNLIVENIGLSLEIDYDLLHELVKIGRSHYPNEFGGFLIGYYSENSKHLHITNTILPKKYQASKYSFTRSTKGIESELVKFSAENQKKIYIGEWHTHPDNSPIPSLTDISAINTIINNKNSIANPVLLIIGYSKRTVDFGFYVWFENTLYKYEK